jgi:hypothetical protein
VAVEAETARGLSQAVLGVKLLVVVEEQVVCFSQVYLIAQIKRLLVVVEVMAEVLVRHQV